MIVKRHISITLFVVFVFSTLLLCAQNSIQKRLYVPKSNNAYSNDIVETNPGNFVLIGPSIDTVNNQLQNNLMLMGVDNNGNAQWTKHYGNNKFYYTPPGGYYGMFKKHNGFLYAATMARDSNNKCPGVILKINFNGDTLWQKKIYDTNPSTQFFISAICPSIDNGLLITGAIQTNTPGFNNHPKVGMYLLKTDLNGNTLWEKRIYKANLDKTKVGCDLVQDSATKRIIVVGIEDYDSGGNGSSIMIFDSLGNKIIQKEGYNDCGFVELIKTRDGMFLTAGAVTVPGFHFGYSLVQSILIKFDTAGTRIFLKQFDSSSVYNSINSLAELSNGDIVAGGMQELNLKYKYEFNTVSRIMRMDKAGDMVWKKYFDNIKVSEDFSNADFLQSMYLTSGNKIAFTSAAVMTTVTPVTFMFYRTDTSYCDVNAIGCYDYVGIEKLSVESEKLKFWPNPADDRITIEWSENLAASVILLNALGQVVYKQAHPEEKTEIYIGHLPKGIYFVKIENSQGRLVKKLIKN